MKGFDSPGKSSLFVSQVRGRVYFVFTGGRWESCLDFPGRTGLRANGRDRTKVERRGKGDSESV